MSIEQQKEAAACDFQLGQRVAYSEHLQRRYADKPAGLRGYAKAWTGELYPGARNPGGEGIIIGKRSLSNGIVRYGDWEDGGNEYTAQERFSAYLVAYDLRRQPVFVRPEHLAAIEAAA